MKKIIVALLMAFSLLACGSKSADKTEKVITFNAIAEGQSFDPHLLTDGNTMNIHGLVSEGLTYAKGNGKVVPGLAKSWDISEDGLTWTFHLRDNLKWSDGRALTANDFVYGWQRALSPELASDYAYILFPIKNAEKYSAGEVSAEELGVKALDDKTLEVKLENITPYFDSLVAFPTYMPANKEFVLEKGDSYGIEAENLLYSGPFKVIKWTHNSDMVLVKNENYHSPDTVNVDKYVVKYIADSAATLNAFKNEELDIADLTVEQFQEFANDSRLRKDGLARTSYLAFKMEDPIFKNENIRKAFALAVDKESLVNTVFNGAKDAAYTFTPKNVGFIGLKEDFANELGSVFDKFNPEKAKEYLAAGLKELGMDKLPTILFLADERGSNRKIAEKIQEDIRVNLGVNLDVQVVTFKERLARTKSRDFQILLTAWGADYQDPMTFLDLLKSVSGNNAPLYKSKEYDGLIDKATAATDRTVRINAFYDAEKLLAKDMPIMPLFQETQLHIVNDKLKGVMFGSIALSLDFKEAIKESK